MFIQITIQHFFFEIKKIIIKAKNVLRLIAICYDDDDDEEK